MTEKEINKIVSENLNYVKSVANQYKGKVTANTTSISSSSANQ